jgi:hypothetical protein
MEGTSFYLPITTGTHEILDPLEINNGRSVTITGSSALGYQYQFDNVFRSRGRVTIEADEIKFDRLASPSTRPVKYALSTWLLPVPLPSPQCVQYTAMDIYGLGIHLWLLSSHGAWHLYHSESMACVASCARHSKTHFCIWISNSMDITQSRYYIFDYVLIGVASLRLLKEL